MVQGREGGAKAAMLTPERLRADGVRMLRCLYCDNSGLIRGKAVTPRAVAADGIAGGVGLTPAMMAMNMLDQLQPFPGMGVVGDVRMMPDPATYRPMPFAPGQAAAICDLHARGADGTLHPWAACPRTFLRRMAGEAAAAGFGVLAGFEGEFSLCARTPDGGLRPADATNCFAAVGMMELGDVALAMVDALEAVGVPVLLYCPELGHGQHEIATAPAPDVAAADRQLLFRETVRAVAWRHGLAASFAPKPFPDQAGNGAHLHWSLWDPDFVVPRQWRGGDLSDEGGWFLAGVLGHLPALLALTCPSVNSYRRLRPGAWASATISWGAHNKEAAVRLLPPEAGANAELKACDHSCNPYLALGGLIACGLDGVRRHLALPPEATEDPAGLSGVATLPARLEEALDALEADAVLAAAMGPVLHGSFLAVKRSEVRAFAERDDIPDHILRF